MLDRIGIVQCTDCKGDCYLIINPGLSNMSEKWWLLHSRSYRIQIGQSRENDCADSFLPDCALMSVSFLTKNVIQPGIRLLNGTVWNFLPGDPTSSFSQIARCEKPSSWQTSNTNGKCLTHAVCHDLRADRHSQWYRGHALHEAHWLTEMPDGTSQSAYFHFSTWMTRIHSIRIEIWQEISLTKRWKSVSLIYPQFWLLHNLHLLNIVGQRERYLDVTSRFGCSFTKKGP